MVMDTGTIIGLIQSQRAKRPAGCPLPADWPMQIQIARALAVNVPGLKEATAISAVSDVCRRIAAIRSQVANFQGCSFVPPIAAALAYKHASERIASTAARVQPKPEVNVAVEAAPALSNPDPLPLYDKQSPNDRVALVHAHGEPRAVETFPVDREGIITMIRFAVTQYRRFGVTVFRGFNRNQRNEVIAIRNDLLRLGILVYEEDPIGPNERRAIVAVPLPYWEASVLVAAVERKESGEERDDRTHADLENITKAIVRLAVAWERADPELTNAN